MKESIRIIQDEHRSMSSVLHALAHLTRMAKDPAIEPDSPQDWEIVDEGFSSNTDPIAQVKEKDFRELFSRLVNIAPAPVGLGAPWKKA